MNAEKLAAILRAAQWTAPCHHVYPNGHFCPHAIDAHNAQDVDDHSYVSLVDLLREVAGMVGDAELFISRINNYFDCGGLWNPEDMDHHKVRILLLDIRDFLTPERRKEEKPIATVIKSMHGLADQFKAERKAKEEK